MATKAGMLEAEGTPAASKPARAPSNVWVAIAIVFAAAIVAGVQFLSAENGRYGIVAVPDSRSSIAAIWRIDHRTGVISYCDVMTKCRQLPQ